MTEESDTNTSVGPYLEDYSFGESSLDDSFNQETMSRVRIMDELDQLESDLNTVFKHQAIHFSYDPEDFQNCQLNTEIKRIIQTS